MVTYSDPPPKKNTGNTCPELPLTDVISNDSDLRCFCLPVFSKSSVMGFVRRKKNHEYSR